jgi:hypothetical protein
MSKANWEKVPRGVTLSAAEIAALTGLAHKTVQNYGAGKLRPGRRGLPVDIAIARVGYHVRYVRLQEEGGE